MTKKRYREKTNEQVLNALVLGAHSKNAKSLFLEFLKKPVGSINFVSRDFWSAGKNMSELEPRGISKADIEGFRVVIFGGALGEDCGTFIERDGPLFTSDSILTDVTLYVSTNDERGVVAVVDDLGAVFAAKFTTLVRLVGEDKLDLCDCGNPFVKLGRRGYCSPRCQKRFYMRWHRSRKFKKGMSNAAKRKA